MNVLFQREQSFVSCLLSFDFHACGLRFQIPVPAKPEFVLTFLPASNPLELSRVWATFKLLAVCLISGDAVGVRAWAVICSLLSP